MGVGGRGYLYIYISSYGLCMPQDPDHDIVGDMRSGEAQLGVGAGRGHSFRVTSLSKRAYE